MKISSLEIKNFRNIESGRVEFSDGINLLYGKNGEGKTNTLEAIYYMAMCRSFRACSDRDLIMHGRDLAEISLIYESGGTEKALSALIGREKKALRYEGVEIAKYSEFIGNFRAVIFSPDNLFLIKGSPDERRRFIDMALSQIKPRYMRYLSQYQRLLKQRNTVLKKARLDGKADENLLYVYSEKLADCAAVITKQRAAFVNELCEYAADFYERITKREDGYFERLYIKYFSCIKENFDDASKIKSEYLKLLCENIEREINAGATLYGPHRDDLVFSVGKEANEKEYEQTEEENEKITAYNARVFASQGQQRSVVLSLKLAEGRIIENLSGMRPVYLFDDVMSELDAGRKERLLYLLRDKQVIITDCNPENIDKKFLSGMIPLSGGSFKRPDIREIL